VRVVFSISLIIIFSFISGCISVPLNEPCEGDDCFIFDNKSFSNLLSEENIFDVISYSQIFPQMGVEATLVSESQTQRGEIYWNVVKDDEAGLSSVSSRLILGDTVVIDTEYVEGQRSNNYRIGNEWFEGRDEIPEYSNPFVKLAKSASENPDGFWPPFTFNTKELVNLDWSFSADLTSNQQVASASNDTHLIIIETRGNPPLITGIETYYGEDKFILKVTTDNISLSLKNDIPLTPVPFIPDPFPKNISENISYWSGVISTSLSLDIKPEQLEIHGLVSHNNSTSSVSFMRFDAQNINQSLPDGTWWEFYWLDYLGERLVSNGDLYTVRTNATGDITIGIFDLWANSWTDTAF
jgi:hypothetical protein